MPYNRPSSSLPIQHKVSAVCFVSDGVVFKPRCCIMPYGVECCKITNAVVSFGCTVTLQVESLYASVVTLQNNCSDNGYNYNDEMTVNDPNHRKRN